MENTKPRLIPELKVRDFQKSLDFYTNLAQFKIEYDRPEHDFAMLNKEGAWLMIEGLTDKSRAFKVGELEYPLGRGVHFQIEVSDVGALYDNFRKHHHSIFIEMEERWYRKGEEELGNLQFLVQDPDGYLLRFFKNLSTRPVK